LSTPKIKLQKRIKFLLLSFISFLVINVLRIFLLALVYIYKLALFEVVHQLFWYFGSIIFVVGIWFFGVKIFKVREIPFYSDLKFFYKKIVLKK